MRGGATGKAGSSLVFIHRDISSVFSLYICFYYVLAVFPNSDSDFLYTHPSWGKIRDNLIIHSLSAAYQIIILS